MDNSISPEKIEKRIEKEVEQVASSIGIKKFFKEFLSDEYITSLQVSDFIEYYNKTVLDRGEIDFLEFIHYWILGSALESGIHNRPTCEIIWTLKTEREKIFGYITKKDFEGLNRYMRDLTGKNQISFCSKLSHTVVPNEFPPHDSNVRTILELGDTADLEIYRAIIDAYSQYIHKHPDYLEKIRKELSDDGYFSILQINRVSDIRILDMILWKQGKKVKAYNKNKKFCP